MLYEQTQKPCPGWSFEAGWGFGGSSDTLLGFEAAALRSPFTVVGGGPARIEAGFPVLVVGVVVAPSWWWGVVFDLWIVVASILHARGLPPGLSWGWVCCVLLDVQFLLIFNGFCKCLRAHGGCLGTGSR